MLASGKDHIHGQLTIRLAYASPLFRLSKGQPYSLEYDPGW